MMMWMMPLMMVWITLALPSGVGVYWVTTNIFSVFASYYVYGRRAVSWRHIFLPVPAQTPAAGGQRAQQKPDKKEEEPQEEPALTASSPAKARGSHGKRRGKRKNRR